VSGLPAEVGPAPPPAPVPPRPSAGRALLAWLVAIGADLVQWVALPLFVPGAASGVNLALDIAVALILTRLLGWHIAFLPTMVTELVPVANVFPTWILAVAFVTWRKRRG
jgi:hypothetical protein